MSNKGKETELITHNMWKIIVLMVHDHSPLEILTEPIEGAKKRNDVLKYRFSSEAKELADAWDRGDDTEEMAVIRKVKNKMEMFKENLRIRLP